MKSPFPGMDPFIEACGLWEDFHTHLIEKIYEALTDAAPDRYTVRTGERAYVVLADANGHKSYPFLSDVGVASSSLTERASTNQGGTAVAEAGTESVPVTLRAFVEEEYRETFVEIYALDPEQRLVTCLEVLSPSNKRRGSEGWNLYLRKRQGLLLGTANLVEIDLLRGGQRLPMLDPWPNAPYTLLVARREKAPQCHVWPAHFLCPLPTILVPLAKPDPDIPLDIQLMIEAIYARSRYYRSIDYARPLNPPLAAEESSWLEQQLLSRQGNT
jgi:Protein of unknown function (DUF4058)